MFDRRKSESKEFLEIVRARMTAMDEDIPEPDWNEFRSAVRDKLLSRSVRRTSEVHRWKVAWALSFAAVVVISTTFLWNVRLSNEVSAPILGSYVEAPEWPQGGLFDDLSGLGDMEKEELRRMLEAAE